MLLLYVLLQTQVLVHFIIDSIAFWINEYLNLDKLDSSFLLQVFKDYSVKEILCLNDQQLQNLGIMKFGVRQAILQCWFTFF